MTTKNSYANVLGLLELLSTKGIGYMVTVNKRTYVLKPDAVIKYCLNPEAFKSKHINYKDTKSL